MNSHYSTRRVFLGSALGASVAWTMRRSHAQDKNSRVQFGVIGCGSKARDLGRLAVNFGDIVACCDIDATHGKGYVRSLGVEGLKPAKVYARHEDLLARKDIDAVIVATPDHWHTAVNVDALRAGKAVYSEKPLTLTIDEGRLLQRVLKETGGLLQVGTQQRSTPWFRQAVALARNGHLGPKVNATCRLVEGMKGGPFATVPVPETLDWDRWLGQAPETPYIPQRCHGTFRWWFEYSGGKLTDWGAHHIDIAQWGLGAERTGPVSIAGTGVMDKRPDCYNTAQTFDCSLTFANGNTLAVSHGPGNGILFEGERGWVYVDRGAFRHDLGDAMPSAAQLAEEVAQLYRGTLPVADAEIGSPESEGGNAWNLVKLNHMGNFVTCLRDGGTPIADVESVHRTVSTCHLCNIAMRLGRQLTWDPEKEDFVGDAEASAMVARQQRAPYTVRG